MPLSAFDALSRGLASLRANLSLVPWLAVRQFLVGLLTLLTVLAFFGPFLLSVGLLKELQGLKGVPLEAVAEELVGILTAVAGQPAWALVGAIVLALVPATLVGVLAAWVWGWFTAGTFAVLNAGEHQAPAAKPRAPGAERPDWRAFRAFDWDFFRRRAGDHAWSYFWYLNLFVIAGSLVVLVAVSLVALVALPLVVSGGASPLLVATLVLLGGLPLVALLPPIVLTYLAGLPRLERLRPDDRGNVPAAGRWAWRFLRRRWAAVLLLGLVAVGADLAVSLGLGSGFLGSGFLGAGAGAGDGGPGLAALVALQVVGYVAQTLVESAILVAFYAALAALVAGESPRVATVTPRRATAGVAT